MLNFDTVLHSKLVDFFVTLHVGSFWPITTKNHTDGSSFWVEADKTKSHTNLCDDAQLRYTISCAPYICYGPTYKTKKERPCETRDTRSNKFEVGKLLDVLFQCPLKHWYGCCYKQWHKVWGRLAYNFSKKLWGFGGLHPRNTINLPSQACSSSQKLIIRCFSHHNLEQAHLDGWWVWLTWTSWSSRAVCTTSLHPDSDPF